MKYPPFFCTFPVVKHSPLLVVLILYNLDKDVSAEVRCRITTAQVSREYSCKSYEYCCGNGSCCTQTYALWYMWMIMVIMIIGCCLFGCWYKKWRYKFQSVTPRRPQIQNTIVVTESNHITTVTLGQVDPPSYAQVLKVNDQSGSVIISDDPPPYPGLVNIQLQNHQNSHPPPIAIPGALSSRNTPDIQRPPPISQPGPSNASLSQPPLPDTQAPLSSNVQAPPPLNTQAAPPQVENQAPTATRGPPPTHRASESMQEGFIPIDTYS